jgi:predicted lipoprotein with Yx(FWY)xxD motif
VNRAGGAGSARHHGLVARGRLRLYLGYAPGAGTTCALLSEGHLRAAHGTDVVMACAKTQGRPHTMTLLEGLEAIPPAPVPALGAPVEEMDLGAVLARNPQVALVDELARGNPQGAPHANRWQDVEDLLEAGIDVISTVSIEQLESVADVARKITGTPERETVPDPVVRSADEVELVDVAPEALRDRMADGHIYPWQQAEAVLGGWFRVENLSVLRELALLWLAGQSQRQRLGGCVPGRGDIRERVVVALGGGPQDQTLIRRAARIAARSGGDLLAVHAARPDGPATADGAVLAAQRRLIQALGGRYHQLADQDIPAALLAFAHAHHATQLVVGSGRRSRPAALWPVTSIGSQVIDRGDGIDVHVVTCPCPANGVPPAAGDPHHRRRTAMQQDPPRSARVRRTPRWSSRRPAPGQGRHPRRPGWLASAAVAATALIAAACTSSSPGSGHAPSSAPAGATSSGRALKTATIHGVAVLTNTKGFTLYSFAPDTATKSKCNGSCAQFWPPVKGPATVGPGVNGKLGTIRRSDGATQATYNGHPLYTYIADTAPGQAKGNGISASGGIWHEVTVSGAAAPASASSGGYGY